MTLQNLDMMTNDVALKLYATRLYERINEAAQDVAHLGWVSEIAKDIHHGSRPHEVTGREDGARSPA